MAKGTSVNDEGSRIVVDWAFEAVVSETSRVICEEGLRVISRIDHFWRDPVHDLHRFVLLEAWSIELRLELLQHGVNAPAFQLTTFSIYELAERETAIVATGPFSSDADWHREQHLAAIADRERARIARMLERLQHASRSRT